MSNSDIQVNSGEISKGVEILLKMSHNTPVKSKDNVTERALFRFWGVYRIIDLCLRQF